MRYSLKITAALLASVALIAGCDRVDDLPFYGTGKAPVLSSSVTTIAPSPADSLQTAVIFSWTDPGYATDSNTVKYILQIDSSGRNFLQPAAFTVTGQRSDSILARDLNAILVGWGFSFGKSYDVDVRLISSYANNNEQYISNTLTLKMTPYAVPPKVEPPASGELFLVGNATAGGWNNPVPVPAQQFARLDSVTYGGVFALTAGGEYLILPVNGDWSHKYVVADKTLPGIKTGGDFGFDLGDNFPGPDSTGLYKITVDFQHGIYTVAPYAGVLPDSLFLVGSATAGAWSNPVPVPSQRFNRLNSSEFEITIPLTGGGEYLLLPENGSWAHKFAVDDNTIPGLAEGGAFGYDLSANFPGPSDDGTYKIKVNFLTGLFTVSRQ